MMVRPLVGPALAAALFLLCITRAASVAVTRGPYVQLVTASSAILRWSTDTQVGSSVCWSAHKSHVEHLTLCDHGAAHDDTLRLTHEAHLSGLQAGKRYYYLVGSPEARLRFGYEYSFVTSPPPELSPPPFNTLAWVAGSPGAHGARPRAIYEAAAARARAKGEEFPAHMLLTLGDNALPTGSEWDFEQRFFHVLGPRLYSLPTWPAFGPGDAIGSNAAKQTGPFFDLFNLPTDGQAGGLASHTEAYYSFDSGSTHFVCIHTGLERRNERAAVLEWVRQDLARTRQGGHARWVVAYLHHAPYSAGDHRSDEDLAMVWVRSRLLRALEQGGTDLVLGGYSHTYERTMLIDGHYGQSNAYRAASLRFGGNVVWGGDGWGTNGEDGAYWKSDWPRQMARSGTVYVTAGATAVTATGVGDYPACIKQMATRGLVTLNISESRLEVVYVGGPSGSSRYQELDRFAIVKSKRPAYPAPTLEGDQRHMHGGNHGGGGGEQGGGGGGDVGGGGHGHEGWTNPAHDGGGGGGGDDHSGGPVNPTPNMGHDDGGGGGGAASTAMPSMNGGTNDAAGSSTGADIAAMPKPSPTSPRVGPTSIRWIFLPLFIGGLVLLVSGCCFCAYSFNQPFRIWLLGDRIRYAKWAAGRKGKQAPRHFDYADDDVGMDDDDADLDLEDEDDAMGVAVAAPLVAPRSTAAVSPGVVRDLRQAVGTTSTSTNPRSIVDDDDDLALLESESSSNSESE